MKMADIPFGTTDWSTVEPTLHKGETGSATWRTRTFGYGASIWVRRAAAIGMGCGGR